MYSASQTALATIPTRRRQRNLVKRAQALVTISKFEDATALCHRVLAETPTHAGALEVAAMAHWQLQNFDRVVELTTTLIRLNPFEPGYFGLRGMALRVLGQYGAAAKSLQRDPSAQMALKDLEAFQANLVRDLIASDPTFAAAYQKAPHIALESRGFHPEQSLESARWVLKHKKTAGAYARPS